MKITVSHTRKAYFSGPGPLTLHDKSIKSGIKLEHDFLSSTEKLTNFKNLYFDEELIKRNIKEIKIIYKKSGKLEIEQLKFFNEQ